MNLAVLAPPKPEYLRRNSWPKNLASGFGIISALIALGCTTFVLIDSNSPAFNTSTFTEAQLSTLWSIYVPALLYSLFYIFFVSIRFSVKRDYILVYQDGQIKYPGDTHVEWLYDEDDTYMCLPENLQLPTFNIPFRCKDGAFTLNVSSVVQIRIKEALRLNRTKLNYKSFIIEIEQWIDSFIKTRQTNITSGEIFKIIQQMMTGDKEFEQFPIRWIKDINCSITPA